MDENSGIPNQTQQGKFTTTHWSVVAAAARSDSPEAHKAMEELCRTYWYPLYTFLRRKGCTREQAEDATQDFFAERVLTKRIFNGAQADQGRFRTWLLNSLRNHTANEWHRRQAQKRGGGLNHTSLDLTDAEGRYLLEPGHNETPEKAFERTWAMTLLQKALASLRAEYEQKNDAAYFDQLKCFLPGALEPPPYHELSKRLGQTEDALKMAVSRLKKKYGEALRNEISRTVSDATQVREELQFLMTALRG
jgi:RNA polymerase sigma-70 factor (ECF subfamily)